MTTSILIGAWALATALVFALAVRVWRPEARAWLPLLIAAAVTAWVLRNGAIVYADLLAQHSWTAATIVLPYIPAKAIVFALLAYYAARSLLALRTVPRPPERKILAAALTSALVFMLVSDIRGTLESARVRAARNPNMTSTEMTAEIERISTGSASRDEILAFLENPLCPPNILAEYAQTKDAQTAQSFKTQVARNPKVPQDVLVSLSRDADAIVRYYAAASANLPETEMPRLAKDVDPTVREHMAWKKALPDEDFARLLSDSVPRVRSTAVVQPRASDDDILKLTADPDASVRANATRMAVLRGLQQQ